ncbi:MAG TPA: hypothetical protein PKA00_01670 [Saprospiraceae bacterium]|nr:hypothetical protein [Saprospiraceae bacterium]HMQ81578.1 hypothetical protein [Saprospiraceae bacterium]
MNEPSKEMLDMYELAHQYELEGDSYHAIKLYKRIIRECKEWAPPFVRLGLMYKYRRDWKACLYYNKKAVSLEVDNRESWWSLAIAATALQKTRLNHTVWSKFGYSAKNQSFPPIVSVRLLYEQQMELIGVAANSPASGYITSIPHPNAPYRYRDLILFDNALRGYHHGTDNKRYPIYDDLGLLKRAYYQTFSCQLSSCAEEVLRTLEQLCQDNELGFEVWSAASQAFSRISSTRLPEYFSFPKLDHGAVLVALAAKADQEVLHVLNAWQVITLETYFDLVAYTNG